MDPSADDSVSLVCRSDAPRFLEGPEGAVLSVAGFADAMDMLGGVDKDSRAIA